MRRERGQSMVVITLVLVGMIAMTGLVIDGGNAYLHRRKMQNASDAAAYAGGQKLIIRPDNSPSTNCNIRIEIEKFAVNNGVIGSVPVNCSSLNPNIKAYYLNSSNARIGSEIGQSGASVPADAVWVEVIARTTFNTFFLKIVNQQQGGVSADTKIISGPLGEPERLQPMAVKCVAPDPSTCFNFGQPHYIWEGGGPGNFGWLSWNGENNAGYVEYELDPNSVPNPLAGYVDPRTSCSDIGVGCWVQGLPGVNNSSGNRDQLDKWINKKVTIVVYDTTLGSGSHLDYHIVGFATFIVIEYNLPGKYMFGYFVRWVAPGEICTGSCMNTGTLAIRLNQ